MVTLTSKAIEYLKEVANGDLVTLSVKGGGCSGFQYIWGFKKDCTDERVQWGDPIENILVLDPLAEMFIIGSEIDYVTELGGSFLKVINPLATAQCGCGESFGI